MSKKEVFILDFKHNDNENATRARNQAPRHILIIDFMISAVFFVAMVMFGVSLALRVMNNNNLTLSQFNLIVGIIVGIFFIAGFNISIMHQDWDAYVNRFIFKPKVRKRMVKRITNSKPDSKQKHTK